MNKLRMNYFEKEDVLHLIISDDEEAGSIELSPNITAELNESGGLIGIEILEASNFIKDSILETVQAKMLNLAEASDNRVKKSS
ncbi:MAG: DUF2283 domain-containing protein [Thermoplasmata archaeon]|nr:MAG: DUF2283 domain-containing protein [Thermoplasmata archaeon]